MHSSELSLSKPVVFYYYSLATVWIGASHILACLRIIWKPCNTQMAGHPTTPPPTPAKRFWLSRFGMGPKNSHFQHARWCCCCWSVDDTSRSTGLNHRYPIPSWQFLFEPQLDHYWASPVQRTCDKMIICLVLFILPLYIFL